MVRTRSSGKPTSPNQEMSETNEKDDGGDALESTRKADDDQLEGTSGQVEEVNGNGKMDVEMVAAEKDKVGVSRQVQGGENLPDMMDTEITDEGPRSTADKSGQEPPCASVDGNGDGGELAKQGGETLNDEGEARELAQSNDHGCKENAELSGGGGGDTVAMKNHEPATPNTGFSDVKAEDKNGEALVNGKEVVTPVNNGKSKSKFMFLSHDSHSYEGNDSGTEEDQSDFVKEIENFFKERSLEFKPPKFYGDTVNCLKLYRIVTRLGGYDKVTSSKLWKQVGAYFKPPRTCTSLSYSFRSFYEKALLDYEKHETHAGELTIPIPSEPKPLNVDTKPIKVDTKAINVDNRASGSGRTRRDAAARAMQGWHSQRLLANGEVSEPIIKDKNVTALQKQEKQLKTNGSHKRKKPPNVDPVIKAARNKSTNLQLDVDVSDLGPPADWVKVTVRKTKDCFEVYALVPGLLREEVRVQTDPAGRLVITGEPEHPDNPWGVTPFKKAVKLPSRIDPNHTSAIVTLHGQLFVRVPFEQPEQ